MPFPSRLPCSVHDSACWMHARTHACMQYRQAAGGRWNSHRYNTVLVSVYMYSTNHKWAGDNCAMTQLQEDSLAKGDNMLCAVNLSTVQYSAVQSCVCPLSITLSIRTWVDSPLPCFIAHQTTTTTTTTTTPQEQEQSLFLSFPSCRCFCGISNDFT